jgi:hypothetical protein
MWYEGVSILLVRLRQSPCGSRKDVTWTWWSCCWRGSEKCFDISWKMFNMTSSQSPCSTTSQYFSYRIHMHIMSWNALHVNSLGETTTVAMWEQERRDLDLMVSLLTTSPWSIRSQNFSKWIHTHFMKCNMKWVSILLVRLGQSPCGSRKDVTWAWWSCCSRGSEKGIAHFSKNNYDSKQMRNC